MAEYSKEPWKLGDREMPHDVIPPSVDAVPILLTRGKVAWISTEDADLAAFNWRPFFGKRTAYAIRSMRNATGTWTTEKLHRAIAARAIGDISGRLVDHINGDGLDNRRENLRSATSAENNQNMKKHRDNRSGFKGVAFHKHSGLWMARIRANGQAHHLGYFSSPEAAHDAYVIAAKRLHGEFARAE